MLPRLAPVLILIGLLLFVSCDREDRIAGVPTATKLGDLSAEQADAFCEQMEEELTEKTVRFLEGEMKHIECFLSAMVASMFNGEDACQTSFDECMATDDSPIDLGDEGAFCAETTAFAGCEVSVGDYATCMHDTLDEAFGHFSVLAELTCADLQTADGQERLEQAMEVLTRDDDDDRELDAASCVPIRERCPGLGGPQQPELQ